MLRWLGEEGSAEEAAELVRISRDILREGEQRLQSAKRDALKRTA
jgi:hypothetical protein